MMTHIMGLYRENRFSQKKESFRFRASEAGVMKRAKARSCVAVGKMDL